MCLQTPSVAPNSSVQVSLDSVSIKGTSASNGIYIWDLDTPVLYSVEVDLSGASSDQVVVHFGIRTINFTADSGQYFCLYRVSLAVWLVH